MLESEHPEENPNHIAARLAAEGVAQASNVDDAIAVLGSGKAGVKCVWEADNALTGWWCLHVGKAPVSTMSFPQFLDSRMEDVKVPNAFCVCSHSPFRRMSPSPIGAS